MPRIRALNAAPQGGLNSAASAMSAGAVPLPCIRKVAEMSDENVSLVLRWFDEVWNQRRTETIDELLTEQSICYTDQGPLRGCEEFRQRQYQPLVEAFPDLRVQVDGVVASQGEVVVRWTATGTHTGKGLPIPPTHRSVSFTGISWIRVRDGKLWEGWQSSNIAEVLRSLSEPSPVV